MKTKNHVEKPLQFDVIVVYNARNALSAGDKTYTGRTPFSRKGGCFSYNESYEYFMQYCAKLGLRAAFATTKDIHRSGVFTAVWVFEKSWKRLRQSAQTHMIFNKFSAIELAHSKLHAQLAAHSKDVQFFHNPHVRKIFDDKLATYEAFSEYVIPTVAVDVRSEKTILAAQKVLRAKLKKHPHSEDFAQTVVLKDQFGCGGKNVFKVDDAKTILALGKAHPITSFVLQPFIHASGFRIGRTVGNIDLRVIIFNGALVQSYIRIPKKGEFRANASQGGRVVYLTTAQIPRDVKKMIQGIEKKLPKLNSFYSLDFIKSSSGHLYFIEGNSTPGLIWFDEADERRAKQLMRLIINDIQGMVSTAL